MPLLLLLLVALLIIAVEIWTFFRVLNPLTRGTIQLLYFSLATLAAISSYITTYHYEYLANPNTRFVGWPIPTVIWQRDNPEAPWLDYVGYTVLLALPMNFLLFMLPTSILTLLLTFLKKTTIPPSAPP